MQRRSSRHRTLRLLAWFAGAVAPAAGCGHAAASSPQAVAGHPVLGPDPIPVQWVLAEERQLPDQIVVTGDLRADAAIDLCSETEGRIVRVSLERGQTVATGAVVVELDDRDATNRLAEAQALEAQIEARLGLAANGEFDPEQAPDVRLARANMERAGREAERYARLVGDGAVARSLQDVERTNFEAAKQKHAAEIDRIREQYRSLQAQQARVALAAKVLEDTKVRAPWSGAVLVRHVDVGQYVRKGDRLASLVKTDLLRVQLAIPEPYAAAVQPGQRVELDVRTRPGEPFAGKVTFVGPGLDATSRALAVELVVDNPERRLQPGSFVTAHVELGASHPSVVVAPAAVAAVDGVAHVFVVAGDRLEQRLVQLGRSLGGAVEVVRGLAAGEKVVIQGSARLIDGALVAAGAAGE